MAQPTYSSANGYIGEHFFTMYFNTALDAANPPPVSAFDVVVNGTVVTVTGVTVDSVSNAVKLTLGGAPLDPNDTVDFFYYDPSPGDDTNAIQSTDGTDATDFNNEIRVMSSRPFPAAPGKPALASASDSGTLGDGITNASAPLVTGNASANATVKLYDTDGTTLLGTSNADGAGHWSIHSSNLAEGTHTLTARQTDVAGNVSAASAGFAVLVDTIGPTGMALSKTTVAQSSATQGSTVATLSANDASAVTYGFRVGNGTIDADNSKFVLDGNQFVAAQNLTAGTYHVYLRGTDAAGNDAYQTFSLNVVNSPSATSIARDAQASATVPGNANSVGYTVVFNQPVSGLDSSDFTLSATGTASGSVSSVSGSGAVYSVMVNDLSGDGTLRLDLKSSGTGIVNASNVAISGGYTSGQTFTLDHTAPAPPTTPAMSAATDTGASSSDAVTNNVTPTFTGTGDGNATVKLYDTDGTTLLGTATANGSGQWSITSSTLASGPHQLTVKQTDAAGNVSAASGALSVVIDTTVAVPGTPVLSNASDSGTLGDGITNIATPTVTGVAESNARVTLYDTDGVTVLGTGSADSSGAWSITSSPLSEGSHTLTARQTDLAGNVSTFGAGLALTLDTVAPAPPSRPTVANDNNNGSQNGAITHVSTPVISGTAAANARISVSDMDDTVQLGTTTADGSGNWSIISSPLALGFHSITARQTDQAGNVSFASSMLTLKVEAVPAPPTSPVTTTFIDGVSVTQQQVLLPGGLNGIQTFVPVVDAGRIDISGNASVADIPLFGSGNLTLLKAQLAPGFGLTAKGGLTLTAPSTTDYLAQAIQAATPNNTSFDLGHLTRDSTAFLNTLKIGAPLLVETITPESTTAAGPLTLIGTSNANQHTALVIDATHLVKDNTLVLNDIDFATILGSVNVLATTQNQILSGDAASQQFSVASNLGSLVFAGGGDDTLKLTPSLSNPFQSTPIKTILHGGKGNDTLSFSGASTDYLMQQHEGFSVLTLKAQPLQQTLVINTETITFSDQSLKIQASNAQTVVSGLYQSALGRQADYQGFDYWASEAKSGVSLGSIALSLMTSAEAQGGHPTVLNGNATHDIEALYQGIYNRQSDAAGLNYWVDSMNQGMTLAQVADNFVQSIEMGQHKIQAVSWDFIV